MSELSERPDAPDDVRQEIERKILAAAFAPLSKLSFTDQELTSKDIVTALAESAVAADAAFEEARIKLRPNYFFYTDTEGIVCTAYAAWCAGADDTADYAPFSVAGSRLSSFALYALLSRTFRDVRDAMDDIRDEELSFRGAGDLKKLKGWPEDDS